MAKVWINPAFKDTYKKPEVVKHEVTKQEKPEKKPVKTKPKEFKRKEPVLPQTNKTTHSENYFNKRIRENDIVEFVFINNMTVSGCVEWFNQRYIKIKEAKTGDDILVDRRPIKYISKIEQEVKSDQ